MASRTFRRAIGAVKDQMSIGLAKVVRSVAPDLEILVLKATTHDNEPADEKYIEEILNMMPYSQWYVRVCVLAVLKRLNKTRDWIVALKALMLVHRLLNGDPAFHEEFMLASRKGTTRVLNMTDFRDEAHSNSWKHSRFVRAYGWYLGKKLEFMEYDMTLRVGDEKKSDDVGYGELRSTCCHWIDRKPWSLSISQRQRNEATPITELEPESVLKRLNKLLLLVDHFFACRPMGDAKKARIVLVAQCLLVKESFRLYADISELLNNLQECFSELDYACGAKAFNSYVTAARIIDELVAYYAWCKDIGVARAYEIPAMQKISDELLGMLERQLKEKGNRAKRTTEMGEEILSDIKAKNKESINEIKVLPPAKHNPPAVPQPQYMLQNQLVSEDPVNQKDDGVSADLPGNELALDSLRTEGGPKVISVWQNPACETGKACWELELAGFAGQLSKQKANLGGRFNALLLDGMYDLEIVRQHMVNSPLNSGSASSVASPAISTTATQVLAMRSPDGMVQPVGQHDPFAASFSIPPPAYVQIADMEMKQQVLTHEQQLATICKK